MCVFNPGVAGDRAGGAVCVFAPALGGARPVLNEIILASHARQPASSKGHAPP